MPNMTFCRHQRPPLPMSDSPLPLQTPSAVSDVSLLVRELRRVTLLWDELWWAERQLRTVASGYVRGALEHAAAARHTP